ncbi:MAG: protein kinase, partial [Myxococcota bacterium]
MQPEIFGSYVLLERIGRGGMGEVFLARSRQRDGRSGLLAIKRLRAGALGRARAAADFVGEADLTARMDHRNIARVHEVGEVAGQPFIAMEYIHGRDLSAIARRHRQRSRAVPVPYACHAVMSACTALDHVHDLRDAHGQPLDIVHCDISPRNLMLSFDGHVRLIDFG